MSPQESPQFELVPGVGALPLRLGMVKSEVAELLGPSKPSKGFGSERLDVQFYPWCTVTYLPEDQTLQHIGFGRTSPLNFRGKSPFNENSRDFFNELLTLDPNPYMWANCVYFLQLKLWATALHDDDFSDQALSLFLPGIVDVADLKPFAWEEYLRV